MKEVTLPIGIREAKFTVNSELDNYEATPYLQKKHEEAFALLEKYPPTAWLRKVTNERIKRDFDANMSIEAIAESHKLTQEDVLSRLEEMGLIEPVVA
jgi:hypothetical protein